VEATNETGLEFQPGIEEAMPPTYWLTRFMMLRLLGVIYAVAFLVAINQLLPLIGSAGLSPAGNYFKQVAEALGSVRAGFIRLPSLFWFFQSDTAILTVAWIGFILSLIVAAGFANVPLLAVLWLLYLSIVHAGQEWYGYGWEIQLLETGFLSIFLCPLLDMRPFPLRAPPFPIIVLFRWLTLRVMLGAGLIKLRSDEIWHNGKALYYHFETQPLPGPLSRWFHFLPRIVLKIGVWFNFLAELAAPLFVFWPRMARHVAALVIILFQLSLIMSGNLSFFNWLTILPALACFDDQFWSKLLPKKLVQRAGAAAAIAQPSRPMIITAWAVTVIIALLSIQPVFNILSPGQVMNRSFNPLELVNTYGAFGTVGQERLNVVFEGTMDDTTNDKAYWKQYCYKALPVALDKQPPQIAPYQLHLDWQMWFAAMATPDEYPWTFNLAWKLLHNDTGTLCLFAGNPFPGSPPKYIRAVLYRYTFAKPGNNKGRWWNRERLGDWIPAVSINDPLLKDYLRRAGWLP
jgi:hypothetical protein